jgi:phenylpropionate dioxygenase-like ring-hydroxylating dioxygenase large terminal subunit
MCSNTGEITVDIIKGAGPDSRLYLQECWYVAAWSHELPVHQLHSITIINRPVLVYRKADGSLTAMADQCCHRHAPLSLGRLEGDDVRCMYHGLKFNAAGQCIEIPGSAEVPPRFCVQSYPVREANGWVWVWMGDPAKADPGLIPVATGPDDPAWSMHSGYLDYEANYLLVNDNLSDFSHIAWVHEQSFAAGNSGAYTVPPRVQLLERGIRITRWNKDMPARGYLPKHQRYDQFMTYDFLVPGVLVMFSAMYPAGSADRCGLELPPPELEPVTANFTSQAVTPLTDGSTRYFFCWGPRASEQATNPQLREGMWALAQKAFAEDKRMIEAQQRNIRLQTGASMQAITDDRGPTMMRKVLDRLIAAEQPGHSQRQYEELPLRKEA